MKRQHTNFSKINKEWETESEEDIFDEEYKQNKFQKSLDSSKDCSKKICDKAVQTDTHILLKLNFKDDERKLDENNCFNDGSINSDNEVIYNSDNIIENRTDKLKESYVNISDKKCIDKNKLNYLIHSDKYKINVNTNKISSVVTNFLDDPSVSDDVRKKSSKTENKVNMLNLNQISKSNYRNKCIKKKHIVNLNIDGKNKSDESITSNNNHYILSGNKNYSEENIEDVIKKNHEIVDKNQHEGHKQKEIQEESLNDNIRLVEECKNLNNLNNSFDKKVTLNDNLQLKNTSTVKLRLPDDIKLKTLVVKLTRIDGKINDYNPSLTKENNKKLLNESCTTYELKKDKSNTIKHNKNKNILQCILNETDLNESTFKPNKKNKSNDSLIFESRNKINVTINYVNKKNKRNKVEKDVEILKENPDKSDSEKSDASILTNSTQNEDNVKTFLVVSDFQSKVNDSELKKTFIDNVERIFDENINKNNNTSKNVFDNSFKDVFKLNQLKKHDTKTIKDHKINQNDLSNKINQGIDDCEDIPQHIQNKSEFEKQDIFLSTSSTCSTSFDMSINKEKVGTSVLDFKNKTFNDENLKLTRNIYDNIIVDDSLLNTENHSKKLFHKSSRNFSKINLSLLKKDDSNNIKDNKNENILPSILCENDFDDDVIFNNIDCKQSKKVEIEDEVIFNSKNNVSVDIKYNNNKQKINSAIYEKDILLNVSNKSENLTYNCDKSTFLDTSMNKEYVKKNTLQSGLKNIQDIKEKFSDAQKINKIKNKKKCFNSPKNQQNKFKSPESCNKNASKLCILQRCLLKSPTIICSTPCNNKKRKWDDIDISIIEPCDKKIHGNVIKKINFSYDKNVQKFDESIFIA